ncbi:MAG: hypothetical protein HPY85_17230 [Anaerolineae bacterium]|nr:hypothetical protein [Anaerolineae bacterium]
MSKGSNRADWRGSKTILAHGRPTQNWGLTECAIPTIINTAFAEAFRRGKRSIDRFSEVRMPICDGCGFSYDDSFKFCPQCGRATPEPPRMKLEVEVKAPAHDFDCPLCGHADAVQKVSAIVGGSTSISQGSSTSSGSSSVYSERSGEKVANAYSSSSSTSYHKSQTELAKKLSLPEAPTEPKREWYAAPGCWGTAGAIIAGIGTVAILTQLDFYTNLYHSPLGVIFGCIIGGVVVGLVGGLAIAIVGNIADSLKGTDDLYNAAMEGYRKEAAAFAGLKAQWDNLYYCHKHDVVYTTTLREAVPVEAAISACRLWSSKDNPPPQQGNG